jgi:hypothetical protein
MDGRPDDVDPAHAAERAQWETARHVREQHDAEARERAEERTAAEMPSPPPRSSRRLAAVAVVVAVGFIAAVGVMLVAIRHRSNEQPSWVAQLGLDTGSTAPGPGPAPARLGTPGPESTSDQPPADPSISTSVPGSAAVAPGEAPAIVTTGDDFDHVYRQIETLEGWLLTHPQPDRVGDIYQPGSPPYTDLVSQLTQLQAAHQTLQVENYRIVGVTLDGRPSPDRVNLRYADTYTDAVTIADGTGAVVDRAPYDGRARLWTLTLQRGDDGRWRVAGTAFVQYGDVVPPS